MTPRLAVAALLAALTPGAGRAHQSSLSYADVTVAERSVQITYDVAYEDWLLLFDVDSNGDHEVTSAEAREHLTRLAASLRLASSVRADGRICPGEGVDASVGERLGSTFVEVQMLHRCSASIRALEIGIGLFARVHPGHRTLARIVEQTAAGEVVHEHVFGPGSETFELTRDETAAAPPPSPAQAAAEFVRLGIEHIFTGYDHVLFLLGLLLGAAGLGELLKIVTSFTLAHTLTLVLATLGYVSLDARLVESVIALSIAYVAVENLVTDRHARRWIIAFVFGLVHGFGFSNVLRELHIPRAVLGWSLASFNVGVELGQVTIVSLLYPALAWSRSRSWNTRFVRAASVVIGLAGVYWFVERAFGPA
jgi:HupE/UreJ protein